MLVSHLGGRGPGTGAAVCCFFRCVSRELEKWSGLCSQGLPAPQPAAYPLTHIGPGMRFMAEQVTAGFPYASPDVLYVSPALSGSALCPGLGAMSHRGCEVGVPAAAAYAQPPSLPSPSSGPLSGRSHVGIWQKCGLPSRISGLGSEQLQLPQALSWGAGLVSRGHLRGAGRPRSPHILLKAAPASASAWLCWPCSRGPCQGSPDHSVLPLSSR